MKYRNSRPHLPKAQREREYIATLCCNELNYEFASPEEPVSLFELSVILSTRFENEERRIYQEGNQFFLVDEDTGLFVEQWTAVHRSSLPIWKEVLA